MKNIIKTFVVLVALFGIAHRSNAQYAHFPESGTISFDKTVHVKNLLKRHLNSLKQGDMQRSYIENLQTKVSETAVLKKKLTFSGSEMNWEPVKETYDPLVSNLLQMGLLDYQNSAYQNVTENVAESSFEIGGSKVFVKDSLLNVKWKITNEYREIAGYNCRRANGLTLDSVYLVAFYTDEIPLSVGPSNIHGLPGMILGMVVPEQHYNIYATKVELNAPVIKKSIASKKDSPANRAQVAENMHKTLGNWLSAAQINLLVASMLL